MRLISFPSNPSIPFPTLFHSDLAWGESAFRRNCPKKSPPRLHSMPSRYTSARSSGVGAFPECKRPFTTGVPTIYHRDSRGSQVKCRATCHQVHHTPLGGVTTVRLHGFTSCLVLAIVFALAVHNTERKYLCTSILRPIYR